MQCVSSDPSPGYVVGHRHSDAAEPHIFRVQEPFPRLSVREASVVRRSRGRPPLAASASWARPHPACRPVLISVGDHHGTNVARVLWRVEGRPRSIAAVRARRADRPYATRGGHGRPATAGRPMMNSQPRITTAEDAASRPDRRCAPSSPPRSTPAVAEAERLDAHAEQQLAAPVPRRAKRWPVGGPKLMQRCATAVSAARSRRGRSRGGPPEPASVERVGGRGGPPPGP